jgi:predicted nucleic acid-binding protein
LSNTGPWVALVDPKDPAHARAKKVLSELREPLIAIVSVLTGAFQLLGPASCGMRALQTFIRRGGTKLWYLSDSTLERAFELMARYADKPMDLADASLVVAAETLRVTRVFTIDRKDFGAHRVRVGRKLRAFAVVDTRCLRRCRTRARTHSDPGPAMKLGDHVRETTATGRGSIHAPEKLGCWALSSRRPPQLARRWRFP